jgi:hypothetical protein
MLGRIENEVRVALGIPGVVGVEEPEAAEAASAAKADGKK